MKKLKIGTLALTFAGCFLGAGYVSGQELWQFFGAFGIRGFWGILIAVVLFTVLGIMLLRISQSTGSEEMDKIVIPWNVPLLRGIVALCELLFLLSITMIMSAGVGALLNQFFGIPKWIGCAVFSALVALVAMGGIGGMVSSFSVSVPILVGATVVFGIVAISKFGLGNFGAAEAGSGNANPLLGSWAIGAVTFASYNLFSSIGILAPLGRYVEKRRTIYAGIILGSVFLVVIAVCILLALESYPDAISAELPMLALASRLSPAAGYVYGFLLAVAMFGTGVSGLVAVTKYLELRSEKLFLHRKWLIAGVSILSFAGSLVGFGDLIAVLYPIFGYLSTVFILCVAIHFFTVRRKNKNNYQDYLTNGKSVLK